MRIFVSLLVLLLPLSSASAQNKSRVPPDYVCHVFQITNAPSLKDLPKGYEAYMVDCSMSSANDVDQWANQILEHFLEANDIRYLHTITGRVGVEGGKKFLFVLAP